MTDRNGWERITRYYFTEKLGVNLEFGGGHAYGGGKVGLSIKL